MNITSQYRYRKRQVERPKRKLSEALKPWVSTGTVVFVSEEGMSFCYKQCRIDKSKTGKEPQGGVT